LAIFRSVAAALLCISFTAHEASAGTIEKRSFASTAMRRELVYNVYVPDGYSKDHARLPVLYLLHGARDDERSWIDKGRILETADRLIAAGAIPPTLIVMPGCTASWWIDSAKQRAETMFWNELEPDVRARYRTIESRNGRLIAGLSAGGFGALRYALKHPDRFAAAAILSPAIYRKEPPVHSLARVLPPFLNEQGGFDVEAWGRLNYTALLPSYLKQDIRVPIYLVSGDRDELGIAAEAELAFSALRAHSPDDTQMRLVPGGHSWSVWADAIGDAMVFMYRHSRSSANVDVVMAHKNGASRLGRATELVSATTPTIAGQHY
jgi:enterochelin esterase-like enzyme